MTITDPVPPPDQLPDFEPPEPPPADATPTRLRRRGLRSGRMVVLIFLALLGAGIPLLALSPTLNPADLLLGRYRFQDTPEVLNLTQPKAIQALVRDGLSSTTTFAYSATTPRGEVSKQDPPPGEPVRRGGRVTLTVSRGQAEFVVPELVGSTLESVETLFDDTGVSLNVTELPSEDNVSGEVIRQEPLPGGVLLTGQTMNLEVSKGAEKRDVPEVRRLPSEGAGFILGNAGFVVDKVTRERDPFLPEGAVLRTDPAAGENLDKGTKIEVIVSDGPPQAKVPSLTGTQETQAIESLESVGLIAATTTELVPPSDPNNGKVLTQEPKAGALLDPGDVVELSVARGGTPG